MDQTADTRHAVPGRPALSLGAPHCHPPRRPRAATEGPGDALGTGFLPINLPRLLGSVCRRQRALDARREGGHHVPELRFLSCLRPYVGRESIGATGSTTSTAWLSWEVWRAAQALTSGKTGTPRTRPSRCPWLASAPPCSRRQTPQSLREHRASCPWGHQSWLTSWVLERGEAFHFDSTFIRNVRQDIFQKEVISDKKMGAGGKGCPDHRRDRQGHRRPEGICPSGPVTKPFPLTPWQSRF